MGDIHTDEIVCGPRIEEGNELLITDGDVQLHRVLRVDPHNGIEEDHWGLEIKGSRGIVLG